MNKILLIGINARYSHPAAALYYLREYVASLPWKVLIKEFTIRTPIDDILLSIEEENPACIGFSVYIWNTLLIRETLRKLDRIPDRPKILLGGPDAGYNPEEWFAEYPVDFIISGHGEEAFRTLLEQNLEHSERVISVKNPPFHQISFPYNNDDLRAFTNRNIYYESSRGCLFRCAYCLSSRNDQTHEFRDLLQIKNELEIIIRQNPKIIKFVDRTFNVNKAHSHAVWEHIIKTCGNSGTRFHFEVHPALLAESDFEVLSRCPAGLFQFEIGIQSTNEETLRAVKREGEWAKIKPIIKRLIDMRTIHIHIDLIAGLPFEDYDRLKFSFNEAYSLYADHFQLGYLKLLPGTEIAVRKDEWSLNASPEPPYEIIENRWLDRESMVRVKIISRLVDALYNSHRFNLTLENLILLHRSPFDFFENFSINIQNGKGAGNMAWENYAEIILDFTSMKPESGFILDCLRWDYCVSSNSNRYPRILKSDALRQKRKALITRLRDGWRPSGASDLDEATAGRSKLFIAESELFSARYIGGKTGALFLPGAREPVILTYR